MAERQTETNLDAILGSTRAGTARDGARESARAGAARDGARESARGAPRAPRREHAAKFSRVLRAAPSKASTGLMHAARPKFAPRSAAAPRALSPAVLQLKAEEHIVRGLAMEEDADSLTVFFLKAPLVVISKKTGAITLHSNGYTTLSTRNALCFVLKPLGMSVTDERAARDEWRVVEPPTFSQRFVDGMEIAQTVTPNRAKILARASIVKQYVAQKLTAV